MAPALVVLMQEGLAGQVQEGLAGWETVGGFVFSWEPQVLAGQVRLAEWAAVPGDLAVSLVASALTVHCPETPVYAHASSPLHPLQKQERSLTQTTNG